MGTEKFTLHQVFFSINHGVESWKICSWEAEKVSMTELVLKATEPNDNMRKRLHTCDIGGIHVDVSYLPSINARAYCFPEQLEDKKGKVRFETISAMKKRAKDYVKWSEEMTALVDQLEATP